MSAEGVATPAASAPAAALARPVGVVTDIATVARRALRSLLREPEFMAPALVIPIFFFVVNVGALQSFVERAPGIDYKAFQLPVAIVFAVTGLSRATVLVTDIQSGYLDRKLVTPVRRATLLAGMMIADIVLALSLSILVIGMGFRVRRAIRHRLDRDADVLGDVGGVEPCVHRVPVHGGVAHRQPSGRQLGVLDLLPVRVLDTGVLAA